jgi:hypothetical protein
VIYFLHTQNPEGAQGVGTQYRATSFLDVRCQNGVPIATVGLPPIQVVCSTPLGVGVPCSELPGHGAPRPGLRMSPRLPVFPFAASANAATYNRPRPPAGYPTSRYFPGIPFREGPRLVGSDQRYYWYIWGRPGAIGTFKTGSGY